MLRTNVDTILILKTVQHGDLNVGVVSSVPAIGDEVEIRLTPNAPVASV